MKREKIKAKCHERAVCNRSAFSDESSKESKEKTGLGQRFFIHFSFFSCFFSFSLTTPCKIVSDGYIKERIKFLRHECESLRPGELLCRCLDPARPYRARATIFAIRSSRCQRVDASRSLLTTSSAALLE